MAVALTIYVEFVTEQKKTSGPKISIYTCGLRPVIRQVCLVTTPTSQCNLPRGISGIQEWLRVFFCSIRLSPKETVGSERGTVFKGISEKRSTGSEMTLGLSMGWTKAWYETIIIDVVLSISIEAGEN